MDKRSKILFLIACIAVLVSVSALFYKALIIQDFETFVSDEKNEDIDNTAEDLE